MGPVLDVVIPVFSIVALGFGLARSGIFAAGASEALTRFMFYVAVPAMLFHSLATTELPASIPWRYIFAFYGASLFVFGLGALIARYRFAWPRREHGIAAVASSYSNMVMLGYPLIYSAYGDPGTLPLFILIALQSTLLFPATTWAIEYYGRDRVADHPRIARSLGKLALNPVILSLVLGVVANWYSVEFHPVLDRTLVTIGNAAPAVALVALGTGLARYEVRGEIRESMSFVALKMLLHPALVWLTCWIAAVPPLWLEVAVLLAAMPTGINAFIFAQNYEIRVAVVSKTIVFSTLISVVTVGILLQRFIG